MLFSNESVYLILLNINVLWALTLTLQLVHMQKKYNSIISSNIYKKYLVILLWVITLLPITTSFVVKFNLILTISFQNIYLVITLLVVNTAIILTYYQYLQRHNILTEFRFNQKLIMHWEDTYSFLLTYNIYIIIIFIYWDIIWLFF